MTTKYISWSIFRCDSLLEKLYNWQIPGRFWILELKDNVMGAGRTTNEDAWLRTTWQVLLAWVHVAIWVLLWFRYSVLPNTQVLEAWPLGNRNNHWEVLDHERSDLINKLIYWWRPDIIVLLRSQGNYSRMSLPGDRGSWEYSSCP